MGFFSWKTQDTDRSICNAYSGQETFTVYMTDNKGNVWREDNYEGYGEFGGKDYYELLAEMNGLTTRYEGIDLAYGKKPFISPNLTEHKSNWHNSHPQDCEYQGFFYPEEHPWYDDLLNSQENL